MSDSDSDSGPEVRAPPSKKQKTQQQSKPKKVEEDEEPSFQLSKMRFATVRQFRGKVMVDLREFYEKDGELKPGKKGIALNMEQWNSLKNHMEDIDQALKNF